jgi:hypothetical protein
MKGKAVALLSAFAVATAFAAEADVCAVPEYLTHVEGKLPQAVAAVSQHRRLDILVMGTGSSALAGADGARASYPARLEAALAARLPNVAVKVRADVKPGRTTAEMVNSLKQSLLDARPNLVVWQTGTVDAIRGVDPDEFRAKLEKGIAVARASEADVILVNMQYSPRTDLMISADPYIEAMRWVAQQQDVPLFDRLGVMKHWNESGAFDLAGPNVSHMAERVHDCLGKLVAELIIVTGHLRSEEQKENR